MYTSSITYYIHNLGTHFWGMGSNSVDQYVLYVLTNNAFCMLNFSKIYCPLKLKYAYVFLFQPILCSATFLQCAIIIQYTRIHLSMFSDARAIVYNIQIHFPIFCQGQSVIAAREA